jgi:hypothetical protein
MNINLDLSAETVKVQPAVDRERAVEQGRAPRANPAKIEDFGDKDLLQDIDLARILAAK